MRYRDNLLHSHSLLSLDPGYEHMVTPLCIHQEARTSMCQQKGPYMNDIKRCFATTVAAAVFSVAAFVSFAHAQPSALAAHVLSESGHTKGVACVVSCGSGELATELATQSGMVVLAMDASAGNVTATRSSANGVGLLGRRVYVVQGGVTAIPLADNYADLLVLDGVTTEDLSGIPQQELLRVLTPYHGTAFVGNSAGGLDQAALQSWLDGFGVLGANITTDSYGTWARVTKPELPGADSWEQRYHGPDNNVVSTDTALKAPYLTQWMGKPYHDIGYGSEVHVANGRILVMGKIHDGGYGYTIRMNSFYMRNAYNGEILWIRDLPLRYLTGFGAAVMRGDSVFMAVGDSVAVLNAETGAVKYRIGFTGLEGHIRRVAILDDVLVVLAGDADMSSDFPAAATDQMLIDSVFYGSHGELGNHPPHPWGAELAAYDLVAHQSLWRHVESSNIDLNHLALSDSKVMFYARDSRAAALHLRTGGEVWQNNTPAFLTAVAADSSIIPNGLGAIGGINAQCALVAHDHRLFIGMGRSDNSVALSADNGSMLWSVPNGIRSTWLSGSPFAQMVMGDTLYHRDVLLNTANGTTIAPYGGAAPGCGVFTGSKDAIIGQLGISYDIAAQAATPGLAGLHHAVCDVGNFVADGLIINSSFKCRCSMPSRGFKVMGSSGGYQYNQAAVQSERLTQAADLTVSASLDTTAMDWCAYRGDNQRTGSSPAAVSLSPTRRFTFTPDVLYYTNFAEATCTYDVDWRVTPPVAAGEYVFTGGWDGKVRCINSTTGLLAWEFQCGSAVVSPPAVSSGRVFFGSCDGYAYACEARTGRLLWKFRAAPAERLVMQQGMLMSTWPVTGGVLVHGGVAYVAAGGTNAENGTHVYALNAASGEIVWQNNALAALPDAQNSGRTANGGMAIAGNRLWLSTANRATFSLRLSDGVLVPGACDDEVWPGKAQGRPGGDIAVFRDRFVMYGGKPFWTDHSERWGTEEFQSVLRFAVFTFIELDGSGNAQYPEVAPVEDSRGVVTPAWDNDLMVLATDRITGVCGWDADGAETFLTQQRAANQGTSYDSYQESRVINTGWTSRWGPLDIQVNAMMLAQNAVVVAYRDNDGAQWWDWKEKLLASTWKAGLLSKDNGTLLWSDTLPAEPLRNGLCVDRSGNIMVALRDGRLVCFGSGSVHVAGSIGMPFRPVTASGVVPTVVSPGWSQPGTDATARTVRDAGDTSPSAQSVPPRQPKLVARSAILVRQPDSRPLWQIAADPATPPGSVVLGSASADSAVDPAANGGVHNTEWQPDRPRAEVMHVTAGTSQENHPARYACDGDLTTRWSAARAGAQTLTLDLGSVQTVDGVSLVWYSRGNPIPCAVLVSCDGERFEEIDNGILRGRGTHESLRSFLPEPARFVRLRFLDESPTPACHIFEAAVHTEAVISAAATAEKL